MTAQDSSSDLFLHLLRRSFPSVVTASTPQNEISNISHSIYPNTSYSDNEKIKISQWLTTSSRLASPDEDEAKHAERLGSLNTHLSSRSTLLGSKPSAADIALYARLAPIVKNWSPEERTGEHGYHHIVRYIDFVQNAPLLGLSVGDEEKVEIDVDDVRYRLKPIDPKAEKERTKKEKAAAAAAATADSSAPKSLVVGQGKEQGASKSKKEKAQATVETVKEHVTAAIAGDSPAPHKKEKKEKQPKAPKQAAPEPPLSPSLIDLRVGHILQAIAHPNADSLYVSTIACGDPPGTDNATAHTDGQIVRTVCSGLNGLIPLSEMQNRKVIVVCNLKPVTMRGIKSAAMVLAASPRLAEGEEDRHAGPVELVSPPEGARAGERVAFEGWEGEPDGVLNPKKKVWEMCQVGFTTTAEGEVAFDAGAVPQLQGVGEEEKKKKGVGKLLTASGLVCTVKTLKGAVVR